MSNQTSLLLCMFLGCGWKLQYPERTHRENMQSPKNQPGMESFAPVIFIFPFTNLSIVTSLKGKQVLWHKGHQLYVSEGQNFSGQTLWGWTLKYNNIIEITLFDIYFGIWSWAGLNVSTSQIGSPVDDHCSQVIIITKKKLYFITRANHNPTTEHETNKMVLNHNHSGSFIRIVGWHRCTFQACLFYRLSFTADVNCQSGSHRVNTASKGWSQKWQS